MGSKEWAPANVLDVFGDPVARATLVLASEQPRSASVIADELGVSDQTVYRRIDQLLDFDLLAEHRRIGENGNQYVEYETMLDAVTFTIEGGGYDVDLRMRQDLTDDFEAMWADLEEGTPDDTEVPSADHDDRRGDPA